MLRSQKQNTYTIINKHFPVAIYATLKMNIQLQNISTKKMNLINLVFIMKTLMTYRICNIQIHTFNLKYSIKKILYPLIF